MEMQYREFEALLAQPDDFELPQHWAKLAEGYFRDHPTPGQDRATKSPARRRRTRRWVLVGAIWVLAIVAISLTVVYLQESQLRSSPHAGSTPAHETSDIGLIIRKLPFGNIAFTSPEALRLGATGTISATIAPVLSLPELQDQFTRATQPMAFARNMRVSDRMQARLSGAGFTVLGRMPEEQVVSDVQGAKWTWKITPINPGDEDLEVAVFAVMRVDGVDTPFLIRTFDTTIHVTVTSRERVLTFLRSNWQWLTGAIALLVLATILSLWWTRPSPEDKGESSSAGTAPAGGAPVPGKSPRT
jgi:hypothetical protein